MGVLIDSLIAKHNKDLTPAQTMVQSVCKIKKGETVLIISNPELNPIAQDVYQAAMELGANVSLIFQQKKTSMDFADKTVVAAILSEPDVIFSLSAIKLGKDENGIENPYTDADGKKYDNAFDYLLSGKKSIRAVWTPGLTQDMFERTVNIDYDLLRQRCETLCKKFENAVSVHVTSPGGTDVVVPVQNRSPLVDDGDFSKPGTGGNVPSGEVFVSPVVGDEDKTGTEGKIVFDGSMSFSDGDEILKTPITMDVHGGFVTDIKGGAEAKRLLKDIQNAEKESGVLVSNGKISKEAGAAYKRNSRNIGELGIGLNPAANITGNMLEDEKAFRTCHFAIGENYDGDAPALIHFDGLVKDPTIKIKYQNGTELTVLDNGDLKI